MNTSRTESVFGRTPRLNKEWLARTMCEAALEPELPIVDFGAGRCMASSNFPVDKAGFSYGTLWNMFKLITAGCSADEKRMIFSDTAKRVYRLDYDAATAVQRPVQPSVSVLSPISARRL